MNRRSTPSAPALAGGLFGLAVLLTLPAATAPAQPVRPPFIQDWLDLYPGSLTADNVVLGTGSACQLCHADLQGGDGWNAYGWAQKQHMDQGLSIDEALLAVEPDDSDADPTVSSNLSEIDQDSQPGWTDGANNTLYLEDGTVVADQLPPVGILGTLDPAPSVATAYCFGDGHGSPCPCANESAVGAGEGCVNSSGSGGLLEASGSASAAADDLTMSGSNLLPFQPGLLFTGLDALNGGDGFPFGDGLRCAGTNAVRLGTMTPDPAGQAAWGPGLGALGGWNAGDTRYFQLWYRDPGGTCNSGFNLTNGLEVVFVP